EAARQRVAARLFRLDRLFEQRFASRPLFFEDARRLVEARSVGTLRLGVADDALEPGVDDERGPAARTDDFEFGAEFRHDPVPHVRSGRSDRPDLTMILAMHHPRLARQPHAPDV